MDFLIKSRKCRDEQMKLKKYHIIILIFICLLIFGLFRKEFETVFSNAITLCLSCMGLE